MKIGFDIHGVIDTLTLFQDLVKKFVDDKNVEVHIISGLSQKEAFEKIGHLIPLDKINGYFSIVDCLIEQGEQVTWIDSLPYSDEEKWNQAKAKYCFEKKIDLMFDDSLKYAKYFENIPTLYCQIHTGK